MNQNFSPFRFRKSFSIFELPPVIYYLGLGLVCIILIVFSWPSGSGGHRATPTQPDQESLTSIKTKGFSRSPEPAPEKTDLYTTLRQAGGEELKIVGALQEGLRKLEETIAAHVAGRPGERPSWISTSFVATGIDRSSFQPRFDDGQISVKRWQRSETAPAIEGEQAFGELVASALQPWTEALNFRSELKLYSTDFDTHRVVAKLVSESFGQTGRESSTQATSIWITQWNWVNQSLTLESIEVLAQEEIVAHLPAGQLLLDCTESILQRCDCLPNQLAYGLDQWARRIANLDIVGNHGVAVGDINQDGLDDIYLCQPHGLPNLLLVQNPDGTVDDNSHSSGLDILDESHAALMVDLDNDRDQDLVVSTDEHLLLFSNTGKGQFQLEHQIPVGRNAFSISAADYDQDGDLDLFLCKFQEINRQNDLLMFPARIETADDGGRNVLLRNEEGWAFKDVTEEVGITRDNHFYSRAAVWNDYDFDGDLDLYITNEFAADQIYENQDGWFSDVSGKLGLNIRARHRSVSVGEFNQDGRLDYFVATDVPLSAYRALQKFNDASAAATKDSPTAEIWLGENQIWFNGGAAETWEPFFLRAPIFSSQSAYGSATADLNNDGLDDVVVTNGFLTRYSTDDLDELLYANAFSGTPEADESESVRIARFAHDASELCRIGHSFASHQRNRCYLSMGDIGFANFSALSGVDLPDDARAVATTDWDNDGDPDIVMTSRNGPQLRILCNQLNSDNAFMQFDLVGTESNADAIGARVELHLEGRAYPLVKMVQAGSGNLSQSTKRLMFGLGKTDSVTQVVVVWPSGKSQSFPGMDVNTRYEIVEGEDKVQEKINERFDLAIKPSSLAGADRLPLASGRSWFYPRQPLPLLQFQVDIGKWSELASSEEKPVVALFCSGNGASRQLLQQNWQQLSVDGVDCTAIFLLDKSDDPNQQWESAQRIIKKVDFPGRWGTASISCKDKLQYLFGEWFSHQQVEQPPFALLIDGTGRVCGFYPPTALDLDQIVADIKLIDVPDWSHRVEAGPLGGRWVARYRSSKLNRLRTRFEEVGYSDDAERFAQKSYAQRRLSCATKHWSSIRRVILPFCASTSNRRF